MSEIITSSADAVTPDRAAVFETQGIPADRPVSGEIEGLYTAASRLLADTAAPVGLIAEITTAEFEAVYEGEGRNEPRTPVGDILGRANQLALFAVTLGEGVCREIEERFRSNDLALGSMLDSVASAATDQMAGVAEEHLRRSLAQNGRLTEGTALLRYSPGYCGWHVSGQKRLFEFLQPQQIGITLRESFLMQPLKSISGVMIAGPIDIHRFKNDYPFCERCETEGCRERIRALAGE